MTDAIKPPSLTSADSGTDDAEEEPVQNETPEGSEDGSECIPSIKKDDQEFTEIKEQMYQDKLAQLKRQLQQLQDATLPEYIRRLKRIQQQYKERLRLNDIWKTFSIENAEQCYEAEISQNQRDYEMKKINLKESLITDWEEKKRKVENDRSHMELAADSLETKPITTRKLRRRLNPDGNMSVTTGTQSEKRRKQSPTICILLDESAINEDLKLINKVSGKAMVNRRPQQNSSNEELCPHESRIEDGKLYFEKRWYMKGQPIYVESKETGRFGAVINLITASEIYVKKASDNSKVKILLSQLQKGKFIIRRRST